MNESTLIDSDNSPEYIIITDDTVSLVWYVEDEKDWAEAEYALTGCWISPIGKRQNLKLVK